MADAQVLYNANTTQNTAGSATFVDGALISAGNFTANKEYLIIGMCILKGSSGTSDKGSRIVHGTTPTAFTDAGTVMDPTSSDERLSVGWMFRFTQPGTAEDVKVQFNLNSGSGTITHLLSAILAIKLSDDFTENIDFIWNEATADVSDAISPTTRANITISGDGSTPWLIIGQASWDVATASVNFIMRLRNTTDGADVGGQTGLGGYPSQDATNDLYNFLAYAPYVVPSGSRVIAVQTQSATTETVRSTRIIAIKLSKFAQNAYTFTAGSATPGATWTNEATISPTPNTTGNWVILAGLVAKAAAADNEQVRLQENPSGGGLASDPAYGDTGPDNVGSSTTRDMPFVLFTLKNLASGAARAINLDAQQASGASVYNRSILAFSVALAAAGTQFNQSVDGSLTDGGAIARQTNANKSGALTDSGTATKQTQTAKDGTLTDGGVIAKQTATAKMGTLTSSGALAAARLVLLSLAGALTSAGAIVKQMLTNKGGTLTDSGAIAKQTATAKGGTLTSNATLDAIRTILKALDGALTSAGAIVRQVRTPKGGTLTDSGAATKQTQTAKGGTLTSGATLAAIRSFLRDVGGALTSAGALARKTMTMKSGTLTSAGAATKRMLRSLVAALSMDGVLDALKSIPIIGPGTRMLWKAGLRMRQGGITEALRGMRALRVEADEHGRQKARRDEVEADG